MGTDGAGYLVELMQLIIEFIITELSQRFSFDFFKIGVKILSIFLSRSVLYYVFFFSLIFLKVNEYLSISPDYSLSVSTCLKLFGLIT